jgi:OmpA-OmpF porin, OOP family
MWFRKIAASLAPLVFFLGSIAIGASAEETEVKGMITTRTGDTLIVKTPNGNVAVVLDDQTKTEDKTGIFGLGSDQKAEVVLIPGLKLEVNGTTDGQGRIVAKTITIDGDDLETSEMIQAGLHPTSEQVMANEQKLAAHEKRLAALEANKQDATARKEQIEETVKEVEDETDRFAALSDYDVKDQTTVKFAVGSSKISPQDEEMLMKFAQTAKNVTGYIVEVTGYADSTGSAAMNTKLSEDRAKAVVSYLFQQGKIPMRHIVAPGAMGEYEPVATNETSSGRADNRRVDIKILVNKGIAGTKG